MKKPKTLEEIIETDIYDLTVPELKKFIKYSKPMALIFKSEYEEAVDAGLTTNEVIEAELTQISNLKGYSRLRKSELQQQAIRLKRFYTKDVDYISGLSEISDRVQQQYDTFIDRYGYISEDDYVNFIYSMNVLKNTIKDFKYEDKGQLARLYTKSGAKGKNKMVDIIKQVMKDKPQGATTEDLLDAIKNRMDSLDV